MTKLIDYINTLGDFDIIEQIDGYDHIGAVVVDGILQASLNYEHVVKPRVMSVLVRYPDAKSTSEFIEICERDGLKSIINWKDDKKPGYITALLQFLKNNKIETVPQLKTFLNDQDNKDRFIKENKGIGTVTAEYFRILSGDESVKIDRHLRTFLANAGMEGITDKEAITLITDAAIKLKLTPSVLDYSIWSYQSKKS